MSSLFIKTDDQDNKLNGKSPLWKNGTNNKAVLIYYWVHVTGVGKQPRDVLERQQKPGQKKSPRFALNSWGLLQIGQSKYFPFSTDQPLHVVHIKHTCCLSVLHCIRAVKAGGVGEAVNRGLPQQKEDSADRTPTRGRLQLSRYTKVLHHG